MMRSKPLVALLGLLVGLVAAATAREGWRILTTRVAPALGRGDGPPASLPETVDGEASIGAAQPPTAASAPVAPSADASRTDDAQVDAVLEQLAAAEDAREPATLQSRFGANAASPDEGGDCPPDHPVKGNTNSMIYHTPGQSSYGATRAEVCFADTGSAEAAGFRATRRKTSGSIATAQDLNT
jgi:hypothetical protein